MYGCMYVCMYVFVCVFVFMSACKHACTTVCVIELIDSFWRNFKYMSVNCFVRKHDRHWLSLHICLLVPGWALCLTHELTVEIDLGRERGVASKGFEVAEADIDICWNTLHYVSIHWVHILKYSMVLNQLFWRILTYVNSSLGTFPASPNPVPTASPFRIFSLLIPSCPMSFHGRLRMCCHASWQNVTNMASQPIWSSQQARQSGWLTV